MKNIKVAIIEDYPKGSIKLPTRGTDKSAGLDFFCPASSCHFLKKLKEINPDVILTDTHIVLPIGNQVLIPSGLRVVLPENTALIAFEKSGLATKYGLEPTCRVIDEDYRGEIFVGLRNSGSKPYFIEFSSKIGQYILTPVLYAELEKIEEKDILNDKTMRGEGGFGSTGNK